MLLFTNLLTGKAAFDKALEIIDRPSYWFKEGHNSFWKGAAEIVATKKLDNGDRELYGHPYNTYFKLRNISETSVDDGVFFLPGDASDAPKNKYHTGSNLISCEMDDGSTEEQVQRLIWFSEASGLYWALIIGSGGKSKHGHIKASEKLSASERYYLQKLLNMAMRSDPAVISPHQPMRFPGFFRKGKGNEQTLDYFSYSTYSYEQLLAGFARVFDFLGWRLPSPEELTVELDEGNPDTVWGDGKWRKQQPLWTELRRRVTRAKSVSKDRVNYDYSQYTDTDVIAAIQELLGLPPEHWEKQKPLPISPEENKALKTEVQQSLPKLIDGSVKLFDCLSRDAQYLIQNGVVKGTAGRDPEGFKLSCHIQQTEEILQRNNINYSGNGRSLLDEYCLNCSPALSSSDADKLWSRYSQYGRVDNTAESYVLKRVAWLLRDSKEASKPKTITKQQWWEKFGLTREANNLAKFVRGKFKKFSQVVKPRHTEYKGFLNIETKIIKPITTTTAITLWEPPLKLGRPYIKYTGPGSIPTYSEFQKLLEAENWLIKQPEIKFDLREWGDAPAREAIAKGWPLILDKHGCGEGKSHTYGGLTANKLEGIERTVFAASNHRNPTVESVEHRKDLIAKHNGLTYDYSKKTPLGNPYQVATPSDKPDDIEPPCVEHKLFNTAYNLQLNAYSGKGSPICQKCPLFSDCGYIKERRDTLGTEKIKDDAGNVIAEVPNYPDIRADLNGLNKFDTPTALIVDEIDQTLESSKPLYIVSDDLSRAVMKLDTLKDKKLAVTLEKLIKLLYKAVESYNPSSIHGLSHDETIDILPTKSDVEQIIYEIYADELTNPDIDLWGKVEYTYDVDRDPVTGELVEKVINEHETFTIPSIEDLITQCQKLLKTNFDDIITHDMTPGEKAEALELNHILDFMSPILKVINGYRKVNLSLSKGYLTITKPWYRHQNIVKSAEANIFLDATIDAGDLRRSLNLDKDTPILVFSSLEKDNSNLTLKFLPDFGHASNQRRNGSEYCETERIAALINQIAENHKDEKIGLIDYKAHAYSHKLPKNVEMVGHWGNDSRGSNQFLDCTVMVNIGDFTENLGALAAKWQCETGQITKPTNLSGGYGAYVQRRRLADLEQVIGRLRNTNRSDEQLTIYLPGKWSDEEINAIASRLSGVNIEKVATYDICQKAARKGQQSERKFVEQIWLHIQRGEKFAQEQIAKVVGLTRGRVSQIAKDLSPGGYKQIKKMLVLLWDTLNKTNIPEKALSELPEDAQWFIKEWVPNFHEYVELGETLEDTIENLKVGIDLHGVSLLEYLSVDTIIDLIKLFMAPMPISFWEKLRSRSGTDVLSQPEPIPI